MSGEVWLWLARSGYVWLWLARSGEEKLCALLTLVPPYQCHVILLSAALTLKYPQTLSSMQGVVSSKEQEIIFYKSQLSDLARAREMSIEAENQVHLPLSLLLPLFLLPLPLCPESLKPSWLSFVPLLSNPFSPATSEILCGMYANVGQKCDQ